MQTPNNIVKLPSIRSLLHDLPQQPVQNTNASSVFEFRPPSAVGLQERSLVNEQEDEDEWAGRPRSQAGPSTSDGSAIRRHRNARACDECRRRKIRCSKAAADVETDSDAPCENCSKAAVSCTFSHTTEPHKGFKSDWQPPKTASSMHRKPVRSSFSRPSTSSSVVRPATTSATFSSLPPTSAGHLGGYSLAFTSSSESLRRLSGTTASSLSLLSSPSHGSPPSSLFAFAPPLEPAVRVANLSNILASTALQKTFLTFSRESTSSDTGPLHAAAASVQSPMGCGLDIAAQAIGTAMIGSAQSATADSDALLLFYYDHFRQGRIGSELLMAGCLKVGRLPPSQERDRRAISLSLIAAWHSMAYASQRPLLPCPNLDPEASLSLMQSSSFTSPSLQTLDVVKASLTVFGPTSRDGSDSERPAAASETIRCLLRFRSLYYRMCFAGREQRVATADENVLVAESQELLEMMPLLNQTMLLVHCMALVGVTLGALQMHFSINRNEAGTLAVRKIAQTLLQSPYAAGGLHTLHARVQDFVRIAVLDQSQADASAISSYLRAFLMKGYLGLIDTVLSQPHPRAALGVTESRYEQLDTRISHENT